MSTSSSSPLNTKYWTSDPVYGQVYSILLSDHIGSWAAADELYTKIRTRAILTELNAMVVKKSTSSTAEHAAELLHELGNLSGTSSVFNDASNVVKHWSPPPAQRVVVVAKKPALVNTFAALTEDDDETDE